MRGIKQWKNIGLFTFTGYLCYKTIMSENVRFKAQIKLMPTTNGAPPSLKNEAPLHLKNIPPHPLKHEAPFHEMIAGRST